MADEDIKKAFQDLQFKTNETRLRINQGEQNKRALIQKQRVSNVTLKNLTPIDETHPVYRSVGRMFILTDKPSELVRHQQESKDFGEKIVAIEKQREYLEKSLLEAETNLRELIQSKRS